MQPGYTEIVASPLENSTAVDCMFRHFRDRLIATRIVNARTLSAPACLVLSFVPLRAPYSPSHSDPASISANEVLDCLSIPRYGYLQIQPFPFGAVVLNTRKQPATDRNVAALQLSTPGQFERLLDSDEAAALLGIHKKTLQRMARSGEVPGFQIGDLWRFRASTLDEWLGSRLAG